MLCDVEYLILADPDYTPSKRAFYAMQNILKQTVKDIDSGKIRVTKKFREKHGPYYAARGIDLAKPFASEQALRSQIARMIVSQLTPEQVNVLVAALGPLDDRPDAD